ARVDQREQAEGQEQQEERGDEGIRAPADVPLPAAGLPGPAALVLVHGTLGLRRTGWAARGRAPLGGGRGGVVAGGHAAHWSRLLSMVLVAVSPASSGDLPLVTRMTPLSARPCPMIWSFGPMTWSGICLAASAKILPMGASPVMSFLASVTSGME